MGVEGRPCFNAATDQSGEETTWPEPTPTGLHSAKKTRSNRSCRSAIRIIICGSFAPTSPSRAAVDWVAFNGLTRSLFSGDSDRYHLLRYEDLIARPATSVRNIFAMAGVPQAANPAIEGNRVVLRENHTVSGNPSRFVTGPVDLVLDDAWRTEMPDKTRRVVNRITAPYRGTYGYE